MVVFGWRVYASFCHLGMGRIGCEDVTFTLEVGRMKALFVVKITARPDAAISCSDKSVSEIWGVTTAFVHIGPWLFIVVSLLELVM